MALDTSAIIGIPRVARVTLSDAQIKALPSGSATLTVSPPSGYRIKPSSGTLRVDTSAGAYTNTDPSDGALVVTCSGFWLSVAIANDDDYVGSELTDLTDLLETAHTRVIDLAFPGLDAIDRGDVAGGREWVQGYQVLGGLPAVSDLDGQPLTLELINGAGNLTGGNAANSLKVTVYYTIEAL